MTRSLLLCLLATQTVFAQPYWVTPEQWGSSPQPIPEQARHTPNRVVLHHAGVVWKEGDDAYKKIRALQSWGQRDKHWPDLPYHFLIAPDGTTFAGRPLEYRPESNTEYDLNGAINVQLWGDLEAQPLPEAQLQATARLLRYLHEHHKLTRLSAHKIEAPGQTTCPGGNLMRLFPFLETQLRGESR